MEEVQGSSPCSSTILRFRARSLTCFGVLAQLIERFIRIEEVGGLSPPYSTITPIRGLFLRQDK